MELRPNTVGGGVGKSRGPESGAPPNSVLRTSRGLREQIAEELRLEIIRGNYQPGESLVERKLAERFRVSHAPVREALLQMANEGLAVAQANYGVRVANPTPQPIIDALLPSRQQLNRLALQAAAVHMTDEHFLWLESCTTRMSAGIARMDAADVREADFLFHRAIVEWSEEPHLFAICRNISARVHLQHATRPLDFERAKTWVEQHLAVLNRLRDKAIEAASDALLANLAYEMQP